MRRIHILLFATGLAVLFAAAAQAQDTATIVGRIRMVDGGPPGERIMVTLETRGLIIQNTFTDNQGQFAFPHLIANPYHVRVEVQGYQPVRETITVNPTISSIFQVRIQLAPTFRPSAADNEQPPGSAFGGNPYMVNAADYRRKYSPKAVKEFEKGVEAEQHGKLDEAVKHYKKAVEIESEFYPAHNNLGTSYLSQKKLTEARSQFEKVIALSPNDAQGYFNLGKVFALTESYPDAERTLHEGLKRQPDGAMGHFLLGFVYLRTGHFEEAEKRLRWSLQLDPFLSHARLEIANLYMQRNLPENAISELKLFIEKYPNDPLLNQVRKLLSKLESEKDAGH